MLVSWYLQQSLATITPRVVLGADVLVGVLGALLQRRHVRPVVPMFVPEDIGVGTGEDEERDGAAATRCQFICLARTVLHRPYLIPKVGMHQW